MTKPRWDFDIDHSLNRFIPYNRISRLPKPISHFLGHRSHPTKPIGSVLIWWWGFIGAFAGLLVVEAVYRTQAFKAEGTPIVIASFGAAAILEYHTIDSPLSQPRNALLGQFISAFVGISISKLFQLSPHFESLRWISGALSVGLASAAMGVTKTVHPPAGATALLCSSEPSITELGWFLLPLVLLGSALMQAVALIINNIQRTYPTYWWTPVDLRRQNEEDKERVAPKHELGTVSEAEFQRQVTREEDRILIDGDRIVVPEWLGLEFEERALLEVLQTRLRGRRESETTVGNAHEHNNNSVQ